jgi:molybdenum ABC transporter molybdate-binding protein
MNFVRSLILGSLVLATTLVFLLRTNPDFKPEKSSSRPLIVYCAAGIKPPMEAVARAYEKACGASIQLQYGGSGTLLSNLRVSGKGDLFLAADDSYLLTAQSNRLVEEMIPLAHMVPVIAVPRGNAKQIRSLEDLKRVQLALANPDAAAIGKIGQQVLRRVGVWDGLEKQIRVFKPTVNDVANDVKLGTVDAGIVWDATVRQYPELEMVRAPEFASAGQTISIGVLRSSEQPTAALRFARFLGACDQGLKEFARLGYESVKGDVWTEVPEVTLFSGGVNRIAIEETIRRFERREGVKITRVYNGCGILVSQMKAGQRPDAYFACDVSFMGQVHDLFAAPVNVSQTDMVLLVPKDNPKSIRALSDLIAPGLKIGVANEEQSALGALTSRLLRTQGLYDQVMANVRVQTPTADLLVNQIRTGSLDAVIVYLANTSQVRQQFQVLPITGPGATATQPFAIARDSGHAFLMQRLLTSLRSAESRDRFEAAGFRWSSATD